MEKSLQNAERKKPETFKRVFDLFYRSLHFFAFQLLDDQEAARDVVQDAFLALWKEKDLRSDDEKALRAFLYSTVRHIALNKIRHRQVIERHAARLSEIQPSQEEITGKLIRAEVLGALYQALDRLPPGCREVFRLSYFEGMNNMQIAQNLGVSVNTIKTHKRRGLKLLRTLLRPEIYLLLMLYIN